MSDKNRKEKYLLEEQDAFATWSLDFIISPLIKLQVACRELI